VTCDWNNSRSSHIWLFYIFTLSKSKSCIQVLSCIAAIQDTPFTVFQSFEVQEAQRQQNFAGSQHRPQALMRSQVTEGGLEPNAIGEFSHRACWVTSPLIFCWGQLGTRLAGWLPYLFQTTSGNKLAWIPVRKMPTLGKGRWCLIFGNVESCLCPMCIDYLNCWQGTSVCILWLHCRWRGQTGILFFSSLPLILFPLTLPQECLLSRLGCCGAQKWITCIFWN